jgi:hypothetical protein
MGGMGSTFGTPFGGGAMGGLPFGRPTVSPYLLLNRGNAGSFALNYYNLVRPQFAFHNAILSLQQEQNLLAQQQLTQSAGLEGDIAAMLGTGHRFGYFTHSRYFMNNTRGGLGAGGFGRRGATSGISGRSSGGTGGFGSIGGGRGGGGLGR